MVARSNLYHTQTDSFEIDYSAGFSIEQFDVSKNNRLPTIDGHYGVNNEVFLNRLETLVVKTPEHPYQINHPLWPGGDNDNQLVELYKKHAKYIVEFVCESGKPLTNKPVADPNKYVYGALESINAICPNNGVYTMKPKNIEIIPSAGSIDDAFGTKHDPKWGIDIPKNLTDIFHGASPPGFLDGGNMTPNTPNVTLYYKDQISFRLPVVYLLKLYIVLKISCSAQGGTTAVEDIYIPAFLNIDSEPCAESLFLVTPAEGLSARTGTPGNIPKHFLNITYNYTIINGSILNRTDSKDKDYKNPRGEKWYWETIPQPGNTNPKDLLINNNYIEIDALSRNSFEGVYSVEHPDAPNCTPDFDLPITQNAMVKQLHARIKYYLKERIAMLESSLAYEITQLRNQAAQTNNTALEEKLNKALDILSVCKKKIELTGLYSPAPGFGNAYGLYPYHDKSDDADIKQYIIDQKIKFIEDNNDIKNLFLKRV